MSSSSLSLRVICLHGKGETAASFQRLLSPLMDAAGDRINWIFPSAPYPIPNHQGAAWWDLPKNLRSFETPEFIGGQKSIDLIEDLYPADAIIGFSQGAILTSVLMLRAVQKQSKDFPKKTILCGAAWPGPYLKQLDELGPSQVAAAGIKSLHVIGKRDKVNPPAMGSFLCDVFNGKLLEHPDGHIVPLDDEYIREYIDTLLS